MEDFDLGCYYSSLDIQKNEPCRGELLINILNYLYI